MQSSLDELFFGHVSGVNSVYCPNEVTLQNSRFFFLKISKEIGKAWRKSLTREAREPHTPVGQASFQTFCLTARAYLNAHKYGLFCSLE